MHNACRPGSVDTPSQWHLKGKLRAKTPADGYLGGYCARFNGSSILEYRLMLPQGVGTLAKRHQPLWGWAENGTDRALFCLDD